MNIIVPMAGMGKRMRPHTLTTPKPLIEIAGKPIVQRLVEDISAVCGQQLQQIAFIIGDFGTEVEQNLIEIADALGAKGSIHYQEEALGTAHAILCAKEHLEGEVIVAFADTLFKADFQLDNDKDGVLWVQKLDNPEQFGVVVLNEAGVIARFVEKPKEFVSDLAMIGIYYFKDGARLREELQYLIDNDIRKGKEYQLPDALTNMTQKGMSFGAGAVEEWLDCGNKNATVYTNQRVLEIKSTEKLVAESAKSERSAVIPPCYLGENVIIRNSVVGPHVSIGDGTIIENSVITNSIIGKRSQLSHVNMSDAMIGNDAMVVQKPTTLSLGDFTTYGV